MADILHFPEHLKPDDESMLACCSCENDDGTDDVTPLIPIIQFQHDTPLIVGVICPNCGAEIKVKNGLFMPQTPEVTH